MIAQRFPRVCRRMRPLAARLALAALAAAAACASAAGQEAPAVTKHSFTWQGEQFLLDGKPFQIRSGEMHYARIPRGYWRVRLQKLKAMGLNSVCTYMFWNAHEPQPGEFRFDDNLDVAHFIRLAQAEGLWVLVRPGPYGCAEWEWGGYPYWLANIPALKVRSTDARFLEACRRYLTRVGRELTPLQITRGGPIIMVQVENEYGSFGKDKAYLNEIRGMIVAAGIDVTLYTSDGSQDWMLAGGTLPDVLSVINFGARPAEEFARFDRFRQGVPRMCGEFYPGWFDSWGRPHAVTTTPDKARDLEWMQTRGISYNIYMFHGGTTFGFMNGANWYDGYVPQVSSYDYSTTLDEAGRPTDKFHAFREVIRKHLPPGERLPDLPPALPLSEIPAFELTEAVSLFETLAAPKRSEQPRNMESLGQAYGFVLYRTRLDAAARGVLQIQEVGDRAQVFADRTWVGTLDRRLKQSALEVALPAGTTLNILVENLGRINFGQEMVAERKGITGRVALAGRELTGWEMFCLPMNDLSTLKFARGAAAAPAFHRGTFTLAEPGDTFLDMRAWRKGCVWVNGHHLGRFWRIGPQQTLYLPAPWLKRGENEIIVLELEEGGRPVMRGLSEPVYELKP